MKKLNKKYKNKKADIIKYLQDNNLYDANDLILIDELLYNLYIIDQIKANIDNEGIMISNYPNQAFYLYNRILRNATTLVTKLGITTQERIKLMNRFYENNESNEPDIDEILGI